MSLYYFVMNLMVRPSKSYLFDILENNLNKSAGAVGLDAGCNNFKNLRMFKTDKYYGLDIDLESIKKGLAQSAGNVSSFGILADLAELDSLPGDSVDVAVSTFTLYSIPALKKLKAVENLCRITAPTGKFFCELTNYDDLEDIIKILQANFKHLKIIYYKNPLSQIYEKIFERQGYLGSHFIAGRRPFRVFAWLLSRTEFCTSFFRFLNKGAFVICSVKKSDGVKKDFILSHLPLIDNRLYTCLKSQ